MRTTRKSNFRRFYQKKILTLLPDYIYIYVQRFIAQWRTENQNKETAVWAEWTGKQKKS
jgi:hypothetical protein